MKQIKVLVVEDSLVFREILTRSLNASPDIEVVAAVTDPYEARDAIIQYKPDVMTLDLELPKMSGLEFLKKLMPQYPLPVIVISSLSDKVFDALNAGAVDFVAKPNTQDKERLKEFFQTELPAKIKIASVAKLRNIKKTQEEFHREEKIIGDCPKKLIAIGASTGGTEAIATVLSGFRSDIPGVVIVQHMPAGFTESFANRLNKKCEIEVREAKNGDVVRPGLALVAPGGDAHMTVIKAGDAYKVQIKPAPKVNGHCPSVDVLFDSVAKCVGEKAIGIILTGMGGDGARGLLKMKMSGAATIGQDKETCVVYGMPGVAYNLGAVDFQEKLSFISQRTYQILNNIKKNQ